MNIAGSDGRITGLDLKLTRVARGVSQRELARCIAVSPQRVAAIEATRWPTEQMCARYAAGLDASRRVAVGSLPEPAAGDRL